MTQLIDALALTLKEQRAAEAIVEETSEKMALAKRKYLLEVLEAKTKDFKPLYPNEQSRELALKARTDADLQYQAWRKVLREAERKVIECKDEAAILEWRLKFELARIERR